MREIKFRAWDKEGKQMYELGHLADIAYTTEFEHNWGNNLNRYELMQYTGLKDKNGKEIYEGDIVKLIDELEETEISPIVFNRGQFTTDYSSQGLGTLLGVYDGNIEVIGNIYENPELIKGREKENDSEDN